MHSPGSLESAIGARWCDPASGKTYAWQRTISVINCEHTCISQVRSWLPDEIAPVVWYGANSATRPGYPEEWIKRVLDDPDIRK
ncbi:MAG: hypothetical protein NUW23_07440 [Firmicutes bacterium]|nr:hypothetical protein [Bacillota bacterium]